MKPLIESAPLVDIGPRFPFYEEYMTSEGGLAKPEDVRLGTQVALIGRFVPYFGDLTILQGLWSGGQLHQSPGSVWKSRLELHHTHGMYLVLSLLGF